MHLLDAVSGIIVYSVVHKRASHPIHLVHSENWLLCSYYNDKTRRTEIASYELYDGNQQSNSTGIVVKYFFISELTQIFNIRNSSRLNLVGLLRSIF